jgi:hypothetical protein
MIIIHSPETPIANLAIRVIHKTWWQQFGYSAADSSVESAQYDLHLTDRSDLTTEELSNLRQLAGTPSLVLTSNLDIIPTDIKTQCYNEGKIVGIISDEANRAKQSFLYLSRANGNFVYSRSNTSLSFYQNMFQQLQIYIFQDTTASHNIVIDYSNAVNISTFAPLLTIVANDYGYSVPATDLSSWYSQYTVVSELLTENAAMLDDFTTVWNAIKNSGSMTFSDYKTVLSAENVTKFETVIDFLDELNG